MAAQMEAVHTVLAELGAADKPTMTVFNKRDLVEDQYVLRQLVADTPESVYISARTRDGIPQFMSLIAKTLQSLTVHMLLSIPYDRSDLVNLCYESGRVVSAEFTTEGINAEADIARDMAGRLLPFVEK
jgi:GTP-binding protein HflX